jgi:hypothetical protein
MKITGYFTLSLLNNKGGLLEVALKNNPIREDIEDSPKCRYCVMREITPLFNKS